MVSSQIKLMNLKRQEIREARYTLYEKEALVNYISLKYSPLFTFALGLYWGEGKKASRHCVGVINSDPNLIEIAKIFYTKILQIPDSKIRCELFLYEDLDVKSMLAYWSEKVKIPKDQFIKTQILPSRGKVKHRKVPYGICNIYFSSVEFNIKIKKWIDLLINDLRV